MAKTKKKKTADEKKAPPATKKKEQALSEADLDQVSGGAFEAFIAVKGTK
jgi:hypothetical protein